ncbi:MAG TPA: erythromycin esterase family protein, partial [Flavipsychrobacter sp.]|nr:erythromycin esterase family protein [Flavipsychrobacter sp.]
MEAQKILGISNQDFYSYKNIDFNPIKSDFDSVEIVGLGENMHNVGTTFEAKTKLIKYLHENLGYDLIVFESGLFDCDKANQLMKSGDTQNVVLFNSIFSIWWSEEVKGLFSHIQQTQKSDHPIIFEGMDIQSLDYSEKYFKSDLQKFVNYLNNLCNSQIKIDTPFLVSLKKEMRYSNTFAKLPTKDTLVLSHTFYQILNVMDSNAAKNDTNMYVSFWKRNIIDQIEDYRRQ